MAAVDPPLDLDAYLIRSIRDGMEPDVAVIVQAIARTSTQLADRLSRSLVDNATSVAAVGEPWNAFGERQHPLDLVAHEMFVEALTHAPVQSVLSKEAAMPIAIDPSASFAVALEPLDGSNNISTNAPIGSIFSVVPSAGGDQPAAAFLRSGRSMTAAGFVMYGPATLMALSVGHGTQLFVLDRASGRFIRSHADATIPIGTREFAINASNYRHWEPSLRGYFDDLVAGTEGPRGEDFTMCWIAALVAEAYRILVHGGIFLYPADAREECRNGRLRLIYEAQPLAFLVEQAGGAAVDMTSALLDRQPAKLHERSPMVFGSRDKVERVAQYLSEEPFTGDRSPLFAQRGLFRS